LQSSKGKNLSATFPETHLNVGNAQIDLVAFQEFEHGWQALSVIPTDEVCDVCFCLLHGLKVKLPANQTFDVLGTRRLSSITLWAEHRDGHLQ
jgi:hypothetical protein